MRIRNNSEEILRVNEKISIYEIKDLSLLPKKLKKENPDGVQIEVDRETNHITRAFLVRKF